MSKTILEFWELRSHGVTYCRSHIYRLEQKGKFPKRVPMGDNRVGWIEDEIDDYREEKIKSRSTRPGTAGSTGKIKGRGKPRSPRPSESSPPKPL